jgi:hypothetical protein
MRSAPFRPVRRPGWTCGAFVWQVPWVASRGPCRLLMAKAASAHLVGVGRRQLLRVPKQWPFGPTGGRSGWGRKMRHKSGCGGRALIGTTFACSCTKGAKSARQALPLYAQVPSGNKDACSLRLPCSHRKYRVSPTAGQVKTRPCSIPSASHSTKSVYPLGHVCTPTHAEPWAMLPA